MVAMLLLTAALADPVYARPRMLMEPDLVSALLPNRLVVLDARPRAAYDKGHVPGARWVDLNAWHKAVLADESDEKWAERVGGLGIDGSLSVVVYDDDRSLRAARVWWTLRRHGLDDVRILNGGWSAWKKSGKPVETEAPVIARKKLTLKRSGDRHATREEVRKMLEKRALHQILDTRSKEEHWGDKKMAKRGGAIPGAKHLEWSEMIDAKTGRFKSAAELTKLFQEAGVDLDRPTTTYCQSGFRASVAAFVLELMTGKPARNYYRSWSEWGNDPDTPIEKPARKK
jgi:thiosulfate/3-mercaptopyruvate sulfurtransferase